MRLTRHGRRVLDLYRWDRRCLRGCRRNIDAGHYHRAYEQAWAALTLLDIELATLPPRYREIRRRAAEPWRRMQNEALSRCRTQPRIDLSPILHALTRPS